jgi:hypothetical protein
MLCLSGSTLERAPEGLAALQFLTVTCCMHLAEEDWLPLSSIACLTCVELDRSNVVRIPAGVAALERINADGCKQLAEDWLPISSLGRIRCLSIRASNAQRLPEGMTSLVEVDVQVCCHLALNWLPRSSGVHVAVLRAMGSNLQRLPEGMQALKTADLKCCRHLADAWLPASSRGSLQDVCVATLQQVPTGMQGLTRVCRCLKSGCV